MERGQKEFLKGVFFIVIFVCLVWKFQTVLTVLKTCFSIISPLIYGCVIAFILNLIVIRLEKHMTGRIWQKKPIRRSVSIILSLIIFLGVLSAMLAGLIPEIVKSAGVLQDRLPDMIGNVATFIENTFHMSGSLLKELEEFEFSGDMFYKLMENETFLSLIKTSGSVINAVVGVFTRFMIGFFFAFYILMQKEELGIKVKRLICVYLPEKAGKNIILFFSKAYKVYSDFITGQCVDAIILGIMVMISLFIFQIPYPVMLGVIVAATALVPVVGAFVGGGVGMFLIAIESPVQSFMFLIIFLVLQQIDNKIIYPHVVGSAVGLPSIWIFAAIIVGGNISGIAGMFLGIPMAALLYTFWGEDLRRRERIKRQEETERETQEEAKTEENSESVSE